jgi:6-pyruvoyltetrahydropterin/6-carboxytetrahydropterin synthase
MDWTIAKKFTFEAAHCLEQMPKGHPCRDLHGHSYTVEVVLTARSLDEHGMVLDYHDMKMMKDWIDDTVDHTVLNDVCPYLTTAECLAQWFLEVFDDMIIGDRVSIKAVTVSETAKTWASVTW